MIQLSTSSLAGDKRHTCTVKEPSDLEAEVVTGRQGQGNTTTSVSELFGRPTGVYKLKMRGSSSLAVPELKLTRNLIGSRAPEVIYVTMARSREATGEGRCWSIADERHRIAIVYGVT